MSIRIPMPRLALLRSASAAAQALIDPRFEPLVLRCTPAHITVEAWTERAVVRAAVAMPAPALQFTCALPWTPLRHVLQHMADDQVTLAADTDEPHRLQIIGERATTTLFTSPMPQRQADIPAIDPDAAPIRLNLRVLRRLVEATTPVVPDQDRHEWTRSVLGHVAVVVTDHLWLVGADGFQLALASTESPTKFPADATPLLVSPQALRGAIVAFESLGNEDEVILHVAMPWVVLTTFHGMVAIPIQEGRYPWRQIATFIQQTSQHDVALPVRWRSAPAMTTTTPPPTPPVQRSAPPPSEGAAETVAVADGVDRLLRLCRRLPDRGAPPTLTITAADRQARLALTWHGHDHLPGADDPSCRTVLVQDLPEALPPETALSVRLNGAFLARARRAFGAVEPRMLIPATQQRDRPVRLDGYDAMLGVWLVWLIMPMLTDPRPSSPA